MFELPKYGAGICLARLAALLESLAVDREWLERRSVVVTGSNGKGSTAAFCASIGNAHGLRTGLFTSPHLYRINERFQIDGSPIGDGELAKLAARVSAAISRASARLNQRFGAFEAMFALACLYFQESGCDFAVFEAGIGGRYDPVRLVGARVTCVTSVDYEHVELLGQSLELIVSDKSDACASSGIVVYGENCLNLKPHLLEYNRHREVVSLFVRDEIVIDSEVVLRPGTVVQLPVRRTGSPSVGDRRAGRISVQQRRHRGHAVPALAAREPAAGGVCRDRVRDSLRPARDALAWPAGSD